MGYIVLAALLISLFIWIVWSIETRLPEIPGQNDSGADQEDKYEQWLISLAERRKFNGIALYIKEGKTKYELCLGFRNPNNHEPINEHTIFRLASVSKQFTAVGIMVMVKQKKLQNGYDTLVKDLISGFPYSQVTIRHLLNHTSGIQADYMKLARKHKSSGNEILTSDRVMQLICSFPPEEIPPPLTQFQYNNTNYVLLAGIIERVSGKSFEEYMGEYVFGPLGLNETRVWNLSSRTKLEELNNVAIDYDAYLNTKPRLNPPTWIDGVAGDGGIFSSLSDLKKWVNMMESNSLLSKEEIEEAFRSPVLENGKKTNYGFGWVLKDDVIWHDGQWLGTNTYIAKNRSKNTSFILMDNSGNLRFTKILSLIKPEGFQEY